MFLTAPEKSLEISVTPYFMVSEIQSITYLVMNYLVVDVVITCNKM